MDASSNPEALSPVPSPDATLPTAPSAPESIVDSPKRPGFFARLFGRGVKPSAHELQTERNQLMTPEIKAPESSVGTPTADTPPLSVSGGGTETLSTVAPGELTTIGAEPAQDKNVLDAAKPGDATADVNRMIQQLQESEAKDTNPTGTQAGNNETNAASAVESGTAAQGEINTALPDTGAALDAMTAKIAQVPSGQQTQDGIAGQTEEAQVEGSEEPALSDGNEAQVDPAPTVNRPTNVIDFPSPTTTNPAEAANTGVIPEGSETDSPAPVTNRPANIIDFPSPPPTNPGGLGTPPASQEANGTDLVDPLNLTKTA